jgi:hypothetical protein
LLFEHSTKTGSQIVAARRYTDAALKNYALIPVMTVVVTMLVGVIGGAHMRAGKFSSPPSSDECPSAHETKSGDYCWLVWEALGNTAMNLITATRTVIKAAAIVIFGCGVAGQWLSSIPSN